MSRSAARRDKLSQWAGGIPRTRQTLTVDGAKDNAEATALVPPKALIMESGVSMEATIVCTMQTSQEFASGETTFLSGCDAIGAMIDPPKIIGKRLEDLRKELGFKTQSAFAEKLGIDKSTYSSIKTGDRNLSFETACVIRRQWGISVDWLFFGDLQQSAIQVMARIGSGQMDEPAPARKRRAG